MKELKDFLDIPEEYVETDPFKLMVKELRYLLCKGHSNPYAIKSIIQYKGIYQFGRDWRKVIEKEINSVHEEEKQLKLYTRNKK